MKQRGAWNILSAIGAVLAVAVAGSVAYAAPLFYASNTNIHLSAPNNTFTIVVGSSADGLTINATSVAVTLSNTTGGSFSLTSAAMGLSVATSSGGGIVTTSCTSGVASTTIIQSTGSTVYTIIPTGFPCNITGIATVMTSPTNGATVSGTITVSAIATSTVGITSVQFYLDGNPLGTAVTSLPYSISWNTASSTDGSHTLYAVATDNNTNTATSSAITVTTSNFAVPVINTFSATPSLIAPGSSSTLSWTTILASSVSLDQGIGNEAATSTGSVIVSPASTAMYTLTATNADGNSTAHATVTVDGTPPSIPQNLAAAAVSQSEINLSWAASTDNVSVAGYDIYRNGTSIATTSAIMYADTGLSANTSYSYAVKAYDTVGNLSGQSSSTSAMTEAAPVVNSGGSSGGGGGGGYYYYPPTTTTTATTTTTTTTTTTSSSGTSSNSSGATSLSSLLSLLSKLRSLAIQLFALSNNGRSLTIESKGTDVWALQVFLAIDGAGTASTKLAAIGPTGTFGTLTEAALAEYQASVGITPASGYFGPKTRSAIINGTTPTPVVVAPTPTTSSSASAAPAPSSENPLFTRDLSFGMTGSDVKQLQLFLISQDVGPAARKLAAHGVTRNFASLTVAALIEFQKKVGIKPTNGYFGPITRAYVNAEEK